MTLAEALAVRLMLKDIGYPTKTQEAALKEAERIIGEAGDKAIDAFIEKSRSVA